ncbi:MAG: AIPR family protein, partial [Prevotella sp.]|nr:AIPR family protein [Prevotella sp.]
LLEKNVRTFLRNKSKVNRKIAETLKKCPTKFFAYNNGISATAKSVEFGKSGSMKAPMLKRITDLQIVNGGQTTASIALLAKEGVDISKVFVPMKINVVRDEEHYKETIKAISVCANSQTPIKESDFESGDEMLKELEKISRSEATPKTEKKWYFERMRGQYSNERNSFSGYEKKMFEEDYPKENVITKTDIARVVMLWEGKPHIACNSREKCFDTYIRTLRKDGTKINVEYFHYIIALTILYKRVYETARAMCKSGDFVSRVTAYAMSALAELSEHRLNLSYIWTVQMLQPELEAHIQRSVAWAQRHLMQNQTRSWARSLACWEDMKEMLENCPKIGENLLAS